MLAYGFVIAVFAIGGFTLAAPDHWPTLGSRSDGFQSSLRVLDEGGPPLLGHRGDPGTVPAGDSRYAAVGATDDQGAYIYVPLVAHLFGMRDALDGLTVLYLALFAIPLVLYPLLFFGLFRSYLAALVAPIGLAASLVAIGFLDIYWTPAWAALALLPPLLLVDARWPRFSMPLIAAVVVGASFATSMRANAGLAVLVCAAMVVLARRWSILRRGAAIALLVCAYLSVSGLGVSLVRDYRNDWVGTPHFAKKSLRSHPVWHNAYIGLGYFPNRYGISYRDADAAKTVRRLSPHAGYVTPKYESVLRHRYFEIVKSNPGFWVATVSGKALVGLGHEIVWLALASLVVPFALFVGQDARTMRRYLVLLAPAVILGFLPMIATIPVRTYELGFVGALSLVALILLGWVAAGAEGILRRRWGRISVPPVREALAESRRLASTPEFRRRAPWVAIGFALVLLVFLASKPVEHKAQRWQKEHGNSSLAYRASARSERI